MSFEKQKQENLKNELNYYNSKILFYKWKIKRYELKIKQMKEFYNIKGE